MSDDSWRVWRKSNGGSRVEIDKTTVDYVVYDKIEYLNDWEKDDDRVEYENDKKE